MSHLNSCPYDDECPFTDACPLKQACNRALTFQWSDVPRLVTIDPDPAYL